MRNNNTKKKFAKIKFCLIIVRSMQNECTADDWSNSIKCKKK